MNGRFLKKTVAAVMAFALVGGAMPVTFGGTPLFDTTISANAEGTTAVLDESTGVLTLSGNVVVEDVQAYQYKEAVKKVVCAPGTIFPDNCHSMFSGIFANDIDLSDADTSNVTDMSCMFYDCLYLESLDISNFNTTNVTDMRLMFFNCKYLTSLDLNSLLTSNVTDMHAMFSNCRLITSLDVNKIETSKVTDMGSMFAGCESLTSLDLSNFDTSNVKDMTHMFSGCESLTSLDLSNFDTSNVKDMTRMFSGCKSLSSITTSDKWNVTKVDTTKINLAKGASISLTDGFDLNFYVTIYESEVKKAVLSGPNGDIEVDSDALKALETNADGAKKFVYPLNATQGDSKVTMKLYDSDDNTCVIFNTNGKPVFSLESSVSDYLAAAKPDASWDNAKKNAFTKLVDSTKTYCNSAKAYFNGATMPVVSDCKSAILSESSLAPNFNSDTATLSLVLNNQIATRLYIPGLTAESECTGDLNDKAVVGAKGRYCFEITKILPQRLGITKYIEYNGISYEFSPMSWAYRVMSTPSAASKDIAMANAIYGYYNCAKTFALL